MIRASGNPGLRFICLTVVVTVMTLAAGCTTLATPNPATPASTVTPEPTATPEPPLDAAAVLRQAASRALDLRTTTFVLEHRMGSTALFPGVDMNKASGVVDMAGGKYRLVVEAQSMTPKSYIEVTVVSVGGEVRMTDFFTGRWLVVPQSVLPVDFSQLGVTLAEIMQAVMLNEPVGPEVVGIETVAGVETHRVTGFIKSQEMANLVPGAGEGFEVGVEVWVEMPEGLVHQVLISGRVLSTDIPDTERLLTLGDFDLPVVIDLPQ